MNAFTFDNSYERALDGAWLKVQGAIAPAPQVLRLNTELAEDLGLDPAALQVPEAARWLSGTAAPEGAAMLAMAYAGHQFGQFNPQLGDGRALLLGEVVDPQGQRHDIHLKGSGRTPFSRQGDGKAVLGPVLREYLFGEAMAALGIPTTRALAVTLTGEPVLREGQKPGAVLTRIAASHLRVGTLQFFAARGQEEMLASLVDYALERHAPGPLPEGRAERALALLELATRQQTALIAHWMSVGFVHGVMNTDNVALSGETIDYGPCAFIDTYQADAVFSSIDHAGRYAYGNQPGIAAWNLARLAEALLPLIGEGEAAMAQVNAVLATFAEHYHAAWEARFAAKLGLEAAQEGDRALAEDLLAGIEGQADFTGLFRALIPAAEGDAAPARALLQDRAAFDAWLPRWRARLTGGAAKRIAAANPLYIPRNHLVEMAIADAEAGEMGQFDLLLARVTAPFTPAPGFDDYALPAPKGTQPHVTFCGT